jgi:hypothetical protein
MFPDLRAPALRRLAATVALGVILACAWAVEVVARNAAALCDDAAVVAATESRVPVRILHALSRTETGRTHENAFGPWPWTVNHAGDGRWFSDRRSALAHAEGLRARGARNLDIGCFQINLRWHGHAFASVAQMFDPLQNARYAAAFLTDLHLEFGDWDAAVAAFHSRTPDFAARYMERYHRIYAALAPDGQDRAPRPETASGPGPTPMRRALETGRRPALMPARAGTGLAGLFSDIAVRPLWEGRP